MKLEVSKEEPKREEEEEEEKANDENEGRLQSPSFSDSDKDEKISNASNSTVLYSMDNESNKLDEYIKESENFEMASNSGSSSPKVEKNAEDEKLDKLLRLAGSNPCPKRSCNEEKENQEAPKPQEKEATKEKQKTPELSLVDCFGSQQDVSEETTEYVPEEDKKDGDYEKQFNNEVRNLFLFTSDSEEDESEEEKPQEEKKTQKKVTKKVSKRQQKRRKDDLREYRISVSEDEKEERQNSRKRETTSKEEKETSKEAPKNGETEKKEDEVRDTLSDSDASVEVLLLPSDSDSEVVQIDEVPSGSSSNKGRKNIKKILDVKSLQQETKQALKMETERKRRLKERQELMKKLPEVSSGSKLILDFDPVTMKPLVVVDENLTKHLKPHQREGVQFMWNCSFESLTRLKEEKGSGCVLAHCMGLGKTLQVITLIHSVLTHTKHLQTVLIICPLITLKNWYQEFKIWMAGCKNPIVPFDLGSSHRKKLSEIQTWTRKGGVLIISYDMFRVIVKTDKYTYWRNWLLNPDIVVCDEGHLMKNPNSELSKCISQVRTLRRIVLTGTPLQNNLIEYYCMVQFVKPNILGTKKEFMNRFVNPITNGQFENSTQNDVKIMKQRSHVLHTLVESFVQRLGYDVLEPLLPEKQEFAISIALTETQDKMYNLCVNHPLTEGRGLIWDFNWFHKVWTHPFVVGRYFDQNKIDKTLQEPWLRLLTEADYNNLRSSNKLILLFSILKKCSQIGDKVLVFSQSLYCLDLIENFLFMLNSEYESGVDSEFADSWVIGRDFFKLTGSTKPDAREYYIKQFSIDPRARLFLISTKTGGLGINLVAANRVILFDASWNPAHDLQSIFRVYRFGQKKPCYVYRFLAAATMEEKIYKRQVTKLSLAHRILDEHQIQRHYTSHNLQELYTYDPIPKSEWKIPKIPKDEIFAEILSNNRDIIVSYHEHNSLLENKEEEELTEEERQAAWENYEKEKTSPQKIPPDRNYQPEFEHPLIGKQFGAMPEISEIGNGNVNHFKVVSMGQKSNGYLDLKNLRELGSSFGLEPYPGEKMEAYRVRVESMLKTIFPWGTPKIIIQGDVDK